MFFKKMCQHPSSVRLNLTLLAQVLLTSGGGGGVYRVAGGGWLCTQYSSLGEVPKSI